MSTEEAIDWVMNATKPFTKSEVQDVIHAVFATGYLAGVRDIEPEHIDGKTIYDAVKPYMRGH